MLILAWFLVPVPGDVHFTHNSYSVFRKKVILFIFCTCVLTISWRTEKSKMPLSLLYYIKQIVSTLQAQSMTFLFSTLYPGLVFSTWYVKMKIQRWTLELKTNKQKLPKQNKTTKVLQENPTDETSICSQFCILCWYLFASWAFVLKSRFGLLEYLWSLSQIVVLATCWWL